VNVDLRPAREDELPVYLQQLVEGYAADMVANGGLDPDVARRKSEADNAGLFPGGLPGPGLTVYVVEADGTPVGNAMLGEREMFGKRFAFVYDIVVDEGWRRRGIGRRAMELLEGEARARGFDRIQLNVFGGNSVARSLYESLGYDELAVSMGKDLD
jgi:ribosomal protein S18 acetylase RimI-like enzyme